MADKYGWSLGPGPQQGAEHLAKYFEQKAKDKKAEEEATGTVGGAQYLIDLAKQLGVIDDATAAKIRLMSAGAQAKALISIQHGIIAHNQQEAQARQDATQERQVTAAERQVAVQQRAQDAADRAAKLFEERQQAIQAGAQLGPGGNLQYFNGVPYRYNPQTGSWTADTALAAAEKPATPPTKAQLATELEQRSLKYGIHPADVADPYSQHAMVFDPNTQKYRNATPDEQKSGQFSHVYYGNYLPDKADNTQKVDLNTGLAKRDEKGRPSTPSLAAPAAQDLNQLHTQIVGGVPQAQGGGAQTQVAPSGGSALDTALAAAERTRAVTRPLSTPQFGLDMPQPEAPPAIAQQSADLGFSTPTTWRNVPDIGYVPRAIPVPGGRVHNVPADIAASAQNAWFQGPPMPSAQDLPPAPRVTPPTDEMIAQMQQQLLPAGMTGNYPTGPMQGPPMPAAQIPSLPPQVVTPPAGRPAVSVSMAPPSTAPGAIPNVSVRASDGTVIPIPVTQLPDYLARPGYTVVPPAPTKDYLNPTPVSLKDVGQAVARNVQVSVAPAPVDQRQAPAPTVLMVHPDDGTALAGKIGPVPAANVPRALELKFTVAPPTEDESKLAVAEPPG